MNTKKNRLKYRIDRLTQMIWERRRTDGHWVIDDYIDKLICSVEGTDVILYKKLILLEWFRSIGNTWDDLDTITHNDNNRYSTGTRTFLLLFNDEAEKEFDKLIMVYLSNQIPDHLQKYFDKEKYKHDHCDRGALATEDYEEHQHRDIFIYQQKFIFLTSDL